MWLMNNIQRYYLSKITKVFFSPTLWKLNFLKAHSLLSFKCRRKPSVKAYRGKEKYNKHQVDDFVSNLPAYIMFAIKFY